MTAPKQNLAYWRRRALRAEAECETLSQFRLIDFEGERSLIIHNADMRVALDEIRVILEELRARDAAEGRS